MKEDHDDLCSKHYDNAPVHVVPFVPKPFTIPDTNEAPNGLVVGWGMPSTEIHHTLPTGNELEQFIKNVFKVDVEPWQLDIIRKLAS